MDDIKIEVFTGESLLQRDTEVLPLIEGYLWERDVIMLFGNEKAGKSILAMQMACNVSAGGRFLGKYQCVKRPVIYLQTEGKKDETAKRLESMMKAVGVDKNNFYRIYKKFLPLDVPEFIQALDRQIGTLPIKGGVLIIDCLYMAMMGDLNDNEAVRKFIGLLSHLLERHSLTCVLVHHAKRESRDEKGNELSLGDKSSYGSVFLRANVDHILFLEMQKDKTRVLKCDTQRSGLVSEREDLILIQPSPLFFQIKGSMTPAQEIVYWYISKERITKPELVKLTGLSESSVDNSVKCLVSDNRINIVDEQKSHSGSFVKVYGVL